MQSSSLDEHDPAVRKKAAAIVAKLKVTEPPSEAGPPHPLAQLVIEWITAERNSRPEA